jgi:hypothetical protein
MTGTVKPSFSRRAPAEARLVRLTVPSFGGVVRLVLILAASAVFLSVVWRVRAVVRLVGISLFFAFARCLSWARSTAGSGCHGG